MVESLANMPRAGCNEVAPKMLRRALDAFVADALEEGHWTQERADSALASATDEPAELDALAQLLVPGRSVVVNGLAKRADLNGRRGIVLRCAERVAVRVATARKLENVLVKHENLLPGRMPVVPPELMRKVLMMCATPLFDAEATRTRIEESLVRQRKQLIPRLAMVCRAWSKHLEVGLSHEARRMMAAGRFNEAASIFSTLVMPGVAAALGLGGDERAAQHANLAEAKLKSHLRGESKRSPADWLRDAERAIESAGTDALRARSLGLKASALHFFGQYSNAAALLEEACALKPQDAELASALTDVLAAREEVVPVRLKTEISWTPKGGDDATTMVEGVYPGDTPLKVLIEPFVEEDIEPRHVRIFLSEDSRREDQLGAEETIHSAGIVDGDKIDLELVIPDPRWVAKRRRAKPKASDASDGSESDEEGGRAGEWDMADSDLAALAERWTGTTAPPGGL